MCKFSSIWKPGTVLRDAIMNHCRAHCQSSILSYKWLILPWSIIWKSILKFHNNICLVHCLILDQHLITAYFLRLFEDKVMGIWSEQYYMGIWQLASLTNIFGRPVMYVYPSYGGKTVWSQMYSKKKECTSWGQTHMVIM